MALDPEASGPDTHYKVLQAVTSAVEKFCHKTVQVVDGNGDGDGNDNVGSGSGSEGRKDGSGHKAGDGSCGAGSGSSAGAAANGGLKTETICIKPNMKVWGYRNVWFTFEPFEVNKILPVSVRVKLMRMSG